MIVVQGRELLIPDADRYIGKTPGALTETRQFKLPKVTASAIDLSGMNFYLRLQYQNDGLDTVALTKAVDGDYIILTWNITLAELKAVGPVAIQIRVTDSATVRWTSYSASLYIDRHLSIPVSYVGHLTELEQIEQDHAYMLGVVDELKDDIDFSHTSEAWAIGKRNGVDVPSSDETYHNNSKYYKEESDAHRKTAERYANGKENGADVTSGTGYHDNSKYYKELADDHRKTAEAYAKGTVDGTSVTSGQTGYHDNAKYYKEQVQSRLNQIDTNTSNIAVQTARIDNIAQLPAGSTSGDAELIDIRVGADGVTYASAGAAVRANDSLLKSQLEEFTDGAIKTDNEFGNQWTVGGYIDVNTGAIISASNYKYSDFYPVRNGRKRTLFVKASVTASNTYIIRYNSSKAVVGARSINSTAEYPIEDTVAYIRMYTAATYTGQFYVSTIPTSNPADYTYVYGKDLDADAMPDAYVKEVVTTINRFSQHWTAGAYINVSTDELVSTSTFKYTPEYIPLVSGKNRTLYLKRSTGDGSLTAVRYDKDMNPIGYRTMNGGTTELSYDIDDDVEYIRCYVPTTFTGSLYISTTPPGATVDYSFDTVIAIRADKTEQYYTEDAESESNSITVVNFGDSIYGNFQDTSGADISVSALIAEKTGYNVINGGFGGCQMHQHHVAGWTPFSMYKLADAIVSGNWTEQDASWADRTALNLPYYFGNTIEVLKAVDFSNVDIITIEYGTNDWSSGDTLVSPTQDAFDTNTFGGALRYTIKKFLEAYPNLKIVVQTPTPRFTIENNAITGTSDTDTNTSGDTLVDLIEEENKVCQEYKIPVIDAYYPSLFNVYTHDTYYNSAGDGVHLGLKGRERLADMVSKYLMYQL